MSGRLVFIAMISFLGISFFAIILGMYLYMKRTVSKGKSLLDEAVNKQENTSKMTFEEFLVYISAIFVALLFAVKLMDIGGTGFSNLATFIVLPPVMALFNARKRTGRSLVVIMAAVTFSFYMFMVYIIIGTPVKAPVLKINNTKIIMSHTKVSDIEKAGFDIYIKQNDNPNKDYDTILSSGSFEKYTFDRSVFVKKGFQRNNCAVAYSPYLLVKNGVVLGSIGLYGHKNKDIALEDSKIIHFKCDENCVTKARENSIKYYLNDIDLIIPLNHDVLKKKFSNKLWLVPPKNIIDVTQLHYGIKWTSSSDHLFWNEYYAYIHFDENNYMTGFEISTEVARDWNK